MVQFSIQVFQTGHEYIIRTFAKHGFADKRSVKVPAPANSEDTSEKKKRKSFGSFVQNTKIFHSSMSRAGRLLRVL